MLKQGLKKHLSVLGLSMIPFSCPYALDFEGFAFAKTGFDHNPHELSEDKDPQTEEYLFAEGRFRLRAFDGFYLKGKAKKYQYLDDSRADWFQASGELGYKNKFKLYGERFYYDISLDYYKIDQTYVSRASGLVATFGGQSIADRYDSDYIDYRASLRYKTQQNTSFVFAYEQRDKKYQQYDIVNLSNLDYQHKKYEFETRYQASDVGRFKLTTAYLQRNYNDKRALDIEGNVIPDSDLTYNYANIKLAYVYKPDKDTRWQYTFNYSNRTDNGGGYWDAESSYLSLYGKYQLSTWQTLSLKLKLQKFSYDNQLDLVAAEIEETNREHRGGKFNLDYEWTAFTLFDTHLGLYLALDYALFESTDPNYEYNRFGASAGFRWSIL